MNESKPSNLIWLLKYVAPFIIVMGAIVLLVMALVFRPKPERKAPKQILPTVEIFEANVESIALHAESQGTVEARTETLLVAEVSGRIQSISEAFFSGGYFRKGDPLLEIDPVDYIANLENAKSRLAEADLAYQQEKALADQAKEDWEAMGRGEASDLTLRKPQLARAKALLDSARATVTVAERNLERTVVRAPYDGRVRAKLVDVGQMVGTQQSQLARIYATDIAEVRLPIGLNDIQYLELPESYSNLTADSDKPRVTLSVDYGGETYQWEGIVDRTEGAIDANTRLAYAVAQIENPYEKAPGSDRPPLKVGLFAQARIEGKRIENAIRIPRKALQVDNTVLTVDAENRIEIRDVEVYKADTEWAIIASGLNQGDRVCLTPLEYAVMGMQVELESTSPLGTMTLETLGN